MHQQSLPESNQLSRSQNHQQIELIPTEAKIVENNEKLKDEREVRDKNSSNFRSGFSEKLSEKNGTQDFIKNIMMRTDSTLNNSGKVSNSRSYDLMLVRAKR